MTLLETAVKASIEAGKAIMEIYSSDDFNVEIKDDNSPLTKADKKANDIIMEYLIPTNINIISEENKQTDYNTRKSWSQCWIVDPLDGTKEFIKRNGEFTVNIALVDDGVPSMGVIYVPATSTLYFGDVGNVVSYKIVIDPQNWQLQDVINNAEEIGPISDSEKARIVGSRSHLNEETKTFISSVEENEAVEIVSKGSSLKFCLVAEGKADLYPRYAPTMEWDTAAGQAICMAVGVSVTALPANVPLVYNKENLLNPWFLVSNRN